MSGSEPHPLEWLIDEAIKPHAEKIATFAAQGIFAAVIFEPSEWP